MSDGDLNQAADDIRWLGARLQGLMAAADALKNLGSINNAIGEKTAMHDDLVKQINASKAEADQLLEKIAFLKGEHDAASKKLAQVNAAHRKTVELLGGALKHVAPE